MSWTQVAAPEWVEKHFRAPLYHRLLDSRVIGIDSA